MIEIMGRVRACSDCVSAPTMRCGRCTSTRCERHALAEGRRCERCELDWHDEAPTRRAAKTLFAPPLATLAGGLVFGALLPLSFVGAAGAAIACAVACTVAAMSFSGACRLVDRSARALFLRERAGALPPARLLPAPRR